MENVNKYLFVALCALGMAIKSLIEENDKLLADAETIDFILQDKKEEPTNKEN